MSIENLVSVCNEMNLNDASEQIVAMISTIWPHISVVEQNTLLIKLIIDWHGADMHDALCDHPISKL